MYKHQEKWGYKIQKSFFLSPIFSHIEQTRLFFFFLCLSLIKQKKRVFHHALVRNKTRDKKKKKIDFI
jgi:hypothetical protein